MLLGIRNVDCRINITNICSHESESSQVRETLGDLSMEREVDSRASSPCCDGCSSKKQHGQNRDILCTSGKLLQKAATLLSGLTKTTIFLANSLAIPASISGRNMFHHRTNSGLGFGFTHHRQGWRGLRTRNEPMVTQLLKNIWQKQKAGLPWRTEPLGTFTTILPCNPELIIPNHGTHQRSIHHTSQKKPPKPPKWNHCAQITRSLFEMVVEI